MKVFGRLDDGVDVELRDSVLAQAGLQVERNASPRSSVPLPRSVDLELAMKPVLSAAGFRHQVRLEHPRTGDGFEYDFWRKTDGIAIEVMGYRADDEIYKDILKFHVHDRTKVGVVLVPRYKWISSRRTEANYVATLKALAFADQYLAIDALVAIAYDWSPGEQEACWTLTFPE